MKEYVYTCLDDFEIFRFGYVIAPSEEEAKRKIAEQCGPDMPIEIWHQCNSCFQTKNFWYNLYHVDLHGYYLWKQKENELVYGGPRQYCYFRLLFLLMTIGTVISNQMVESILFGFFIALTFVYSQKLIIQHERIVYKSRILFKTQAKSIDISKATKVLLKEREFKTDSGKRQYYHFVCLEKDGKEIIIYGRTISNLHARKMAKNIGEFLGLPVQISSSPEAL
jgi:hypothetical protein